MRIYFEQIPAGADAGDYPPDTIFIFYEHPRKRDPVTFQLIRPPKKKLIYPEDCKPQCEEAEHMKTVQAVLDGYLHELNQYQEYLLRKDTDTQQEQMMQWYQEHRNEEWPGDVDNMDRVFRSMTQPDTPATEKRVIKYIDCVPYFLHEGEWLPFPKRGHLYYDFVVETSAYKEAIPIIDEIIKENLGEMYGCFGSCHIIWRQEKQLLLEKYGIEWFSPAELNRLVCFD